ncbi:MAG: hypothetical protein ABIV50_14970, partial [Opitutus sp.]
MKTHPRLMESGSILSVTGGVTLVAWSALAWRSQGGGAPLGWMLVTMGLTWAALLVALRHVVPTDSPRILLFGLAVRLAALAAQPVMEDDYYRFLWDGYRFAATGNPYTEAPMERFGDSTVPIEFQAILTRINHPDVPTIYGPLTEWTFRICHAIAPGRLWPWKLVLLGADVAVLLLLWSEVGVRGRLLLASCPLAIFETGFNAHPDVLAIALIIAAWTLRRRGWSVTAGAVAGLAITAKIFSLLLVPFVLWRIGWRGWLAALA